MLRVIRLPRRSWQRQPSRTNWYKIWADAAYRGKELADWCRQQGGGQLEVVEREPGTRGFSVQRARWKVERTFAWMGRSRRLA